MYTPPAFAEERLDVLHDWIDANPFGALVTATPDGLVATHLPWILDRARGPHGTLEGHIARANPHHAHREHAGESLVIFTGPDAYITPAWYPSKAAHGKVVPTWNYVAVHVHGVARFSDDPERLRRHVEALTARHERGRDHPWLVSDAPERFITQLLGAIVSVEVEITRIEGKWKASQNRSQADIDGVAAGLAASADPRERAMGEVVRARGA